MFACVSQNKETFQCLWSIFTLMLYQTHEILTTPAIFYALNSPISQRFPLYPEVQLQLYSSLKVGKQHAPFYKDSPCKASAQHKDKTIDLQRSQLFHSVRIYFKNPRKYWWLVFIKELLSKNSPLCVFKYHDWFRMKLNGKIFGYIMLEQC